MTALEAMAVAAVRAHRRAAALRAALAGAAAVGLMALLLAVWPGACRAEPPQVAGQRCTWLALQGGAVVPLRVLLLGPLPLIDGPGWWVRHLDPAPPIGLRSAWIASAAQLVGCAA